MSKCIKGQLLFKASLNLNKYGISKKLWLSLLKAISSYAKSKFKSFKQYFFMKFLMKMLLTLETVFWFLADMKKILIKKKLQSEGRWGKEMQFGNCSQKFCILYRKNRTQQQWKNPTTWSLRLLFSCNEAISQGECIKKLNNHESFG